MKIAIYQPRISYYVGGGEVVPLEMAKYFASHGHDVTIVTSKTPMGFSEYFDSYRRQNHKIKFVYLKPCKSIEWIYKIKPGTSQIYLPLDFRQ